MNMHFQNMIKIIFTKLLAYVVSTICKKIVKITQSITDETKVIYDDERLDTLDLQHGIYHDKHYDTSTILSKNHSNIKSYVSRDKKSILCEIQLKAHKNNIKAR